MSFSSPVNEFDDVVDGIMKFNGESFEWIFDSMYKTRFVTELNGWSYGSHGPFYGIFASPHNDDICLVSNIETVYLMEYPVFVFFNTGRPNCSNRSSPNCFVELILNGPLE